MAAAANHSPRSSGYSDPSAAQSKRGTAARGVVSPWTDVVRGGESESFASSSAPPAAADVPSSPSASAADRSPSKAAAADFSSLSLSPPDHSAGESQTDFSNNAAKKQVWNKPSNGVVEVGPVMGAVSWPALSETTRASPKTSSSDSLNPLSDPSVSVSQGTGSVSSSAQKLVPNNANPSSTPNHVIPTRQKSMKKGGGSSSGNVTANGSFPHPLPPLGPVVEMPSNNAGRSGVAVPELSPRDHTNKESGQRGGFGSQSHGGNDHPQQRNSFRRGNGGSYSRGEGSYHQNYRGRRDQDGGNHDWNSHRSFSGRDAHMHPQRVVPRGFIRTPPHSSTPFVPPPRPPPPVPVQPFGNPMVYPEVPSPVIYVPAPSPDSFRVMPVAQMAPHPMFFAIQDPLRLKIVNQIEYYFSNDNLIKDTFLRQKMDEQGWVPINLIAGFAKVKLLTDSIPLILDALCLSTKVEVKDDKVRRCDEWWRWIMPPAAQFQNVSSPQSLGRSSHDMLAANIQSMSLEEKMSKQGQDLSRSSSGELSTQSQRSSGEGTSQAAVQAGEHYAPARSSNK